MDFPLQYSRKEQGARACARSVSERSAQTGDKPGVPIIPVSLNGSYKMFEEKGYLTSANIDIIIHEPIETKGLSRQEEKALSDKVEKTVTEGVRKLAEEDAQRRS